MITRLRRLRPSPAMVVACLALLVALAGTSVAAVQVVVPRNSVGALALKPNSVNSSKVLNHSLLKADFKAGQLPAGPRGLPGPAGPDGPAGPGRPGRSGRSFRGRYPGYVAEVLTVTGTKDDQTSSTSFTAIDAAKLNVTVPNNETDKLLVSFNAETACYDRAGAHCLRPDHRRRQRDRPGAGQGLGVRQQTPPARSDSQAQHGIVRDQPDAERRRAHGPGSRSQRPLRRPSSGTTTGRSPHSASASPNRSADPTSRGQVWACPRGEAAPWP